MFVLGDIKRPISHPVREGLYEVSDEMDGSYRQMLHDEALRLGYVGITRARYQLHWFFSTDDSTKNCISYLLSPDVSPQKVPSSVI